MPSPDLSRRRALGLVLAGLAASGCDAIGADEPAPGSGRSGTGTTPDTSPSPAEDPDVLLVETVRSDLGAALALVTASARATPALASELAPFRKLHRRHLAALPGDATAPPAREVTGGPARIRTDVRRQEERLQRGLARSAVAARSGPLAALLASMSAAVAQLLAPGTDEPA